MPFWKKQHNKSKKVYYPQAIAPVMHTQMKQGKSVHIKGLGYFRYTLDTVGVADLKDFDFQKQVKAVRVEFTPPNGRRLPGAPTPVPSWTAVCWNG